MGDLIDQTEVMDQILQILIQLSWTHVEFICVKYNKTSTKYNMSSKWSKSLVRKKKKQHIFSQISSAYKNACSVTSPDTAIQPIL